MAALVKVNTTTGHRVDLTNVAAAAGSQQKIALDMQPGEVLMLDGDLNDYDIKTIGNTLILQAADGTEITINNAFADGIANNLNAPKLFFQSGTIYQPSTVNTQQVSTAGLTASTTDLSFSYASLSIAQTIQSYFESFSDAISTTLRSSINQGFSSSTLTISFKPFDPNNIPTISTTPPVTTVVLYNLKGILRGGDNLIGTAGDDILYMDGDFSSPESIAGLITWFEAYDPQGHYSLFYHGDSVWDGVYNKMGGIHFQYYNYGYEYPYVNYYDNPDMINLYYDDNYNYDLPVIDYSNTPKSFMEFKDNAYLQTDILANTHGRIAAGDDSFTMAVVWRAADAGNNTQTLFEQRDASNNVSIIAKNGMYGLNINGVENLFAPYTFDATTISIFSLDASGNIILKDNNGIHTSTFNAADLDLLTTGKMSLGGTAEVNPTNFFGRTGISAQLAEFLIYEDALSNTPANGAVTSDIQDLYDMLLNKYAFREGSSNIALANSNANQALIIPTDDGHDTAMGGDGADIFHFSEVSFSANGSTGSYDTILDFTPGEDKIHIDLSMMIDFYSDNWGSIVYWEASGSDTLVKIRWNTYENDPFAETEILLQGVSSTSLQTSDFILNNTWGGWGNVQTINGNDNPNIFVLGGDGSTVYAHGDDDFILIDSGRFDTSNDYIFAGAGNDYIGIDHYHDGTSSVRIEQVSGGSGNDVIHVMETITTGANFDSLFVGGSGNDVFKIDTLSFPNYSIYLDFSGAGKTISSSLTELETAIGATGLGLDANGELIDSSGALKQLTPTEMSNLDFMYLIGIEEIDFSMGPRSTLFSLSGLTEDSLLDLTDPGKNELFVYMSDPRSYSLGTSQVILTNSDWTYTGVNNIARTDYNSGNVESHNYRTYVDGSATLYVREQNEIGVFLV